MIIYLDESGDLGFDFSKPKTTRKFVITLLVCENKNASDSFRFAVRRTLKNKLNNGKNRSVHELKGTETALPIKQYFHRQLGTNGWHIYTVVLNKQRVNDDLRKPLAKKKLYNFLARFILEKIDLSLAAPAVTLILDRCKNRDEIRDFNSYVENQLQALLPLNIPLNIYHERSHENAGLQAVDLFCWGIFRKYEKLDTAWYEMYRSSIIYETEYLR
ncbi:MAG: hypothetical protein FD164_803 [Nitrospirae bacterium]|nr:MAG: hypothetical protein FD164_803 [Nitrospirota bacterium]